MDFVISIIGVVLFIGLTAYDTQKITTNRAYATYPVLGAFILYIDFINMFLYILRLFGSRK
jgi:FtsH-binding integral membrane protein